MHKMKTITRRTALAVLVTLPLLPVSAFATPADPAVEAYRTWRAAFDVYNDSFKHPEALVSDEFVQPFHDRELAAHLALCDTVATTPAGLAKQVRAAFYVFGEVSRDDDWHSPTLYEAESFNHIHGKRLLLSMLAGAENMAGVA
jgi:hypothetical protein